MKCIIKIVFNDVNQIWASHVIQELDKAAKSLGYTHFLVYQDGGGCLRVGDRIIVNQAWMEMASEAEGDA